MLYLNLNSRFTVTDKSERRVVFSHISEAEVNESVKNIGDTATVHIPRNYGSIRDKAILDYIQVGDAVKLELGYNGELFTEFEGFIREIESGYPLKLHLDDAFYQLRKNNFNKSWKSITLKDLLTEIAPGYTIECPDVNLGAFQIDNASTLWVLRELQLQYGFHSFLKGNTLYCQFAYDVRGVGESYTYDFQKNVRKGKSNLKFQRKEDFKIRIRAISNLSNGKKITVEVGTKDKDASMRTLNYRDKSESELRELATQELNRLVFDGFTGSIAGFGYPRVHAGDALELKSEKEPERNGRYLVESVQIRYGNAYYERICELSYKL